MSVEQRIGTARRRLGSTRRTGAFALFAALLCAATLYPPRLAGAHVAPAVDANNRYLRVTPMRDRIRLAYTVYIGERPGVDARRRMDRNGDGALSETEANAYGDELASTILPGLEITVDGAPYTLTWAERYVGLGMPTTSAGSFSIDLIAWICAADGPSHSAVLFDRYRVPLPGETEVKVQTSPGITIERSSLGSDRRASQLDMKWRGNDGPMAKLGLYLEYAVDGERAAAPPGAHCEKRKAGQEGSPEGGAPGRNWPVLIGFVVAALVGLIVLVRRRQKPDRQIRPSA